MNTASKNCKCEVDEDFGLFPSLVTGYTLKTLLKGDVVLYWEEGDWGEGITILCCVLTFCRTSKVTYKLRSGLFWLILLLICKTKRCLNKAKRSWIFEQN